MSLPAVILIAASNNTRPRSKDVPSAKAIFYTPQFSACAQYCSSVITFPVWSTLIVILRLDRRPDHVWSIQDGQRSGFVPLRAFSRLDPQVQFQIPVYPVDPFVIPQM